MQQNKRQCSKCLLLKPENEFYHHNGSQQCIKCVLAYQANYRKIARAASLGTARKSKLKLHYGITIEELEAFKSRHNHRCFICNQKTKRLCIDHCHVDHRIRGILCNKCNLAIGQFHDNPKLLRRAAKYLVKYDGK